MHVDIITPSKAFAAGPIVLLLLSGVAGCTDPSNTGCEGNGEDCDVGPPSEAPYVDPALFDQMDAACGYTVTLEANWPTPGPSGELDFTDIQLLRPTSECLDIIEQTVPWDGVGAEVKRSVADALWLQWYSPALHNPEGIFAGFMPMPPQAASYAVADLGEPLPDSETGAVNPATRDQFFDVVFKVSLGEGSSTGWASYQNHTILVFSALHAYATYEDGLVDWSFQGGERFASAAVLFHETLHGMSTDFDHETCQNDLVDGCDGDLETSAYALDAAWSDAALLGWLTLGVELEAPILSDTAVARALHRQCDSARRVEVESYPWPITMECGDFENWVVDYTNAVDDALGL